MGRYVFKLPDVGEGTAEAELVAWRVAVGDAVEEDQPLADVMTDKATVEITSPVAGVVRELHGEPGEMRVVRGDLVILEVEGPGESAPAVESGSRPRSPGDSPPAEGEAASASDPEPPPLTGEVAPKPTPTRGALDVRDPGPKPLASPAVRRRAYELGVELHGVAGSGPAGRISRADLDAHLAAPAPAPVPAADARYARREAVDDLKIIGLRRRIAQQMQESKRRIPHFAYIEECDVTALEDLRAHLNATRRADRPKLTLLPFLVRALGKALPGYPNINARFDDEAGVLHRHAAVHLGIATQTPNGLVVPVIRHAETLDLWAAAAEIARLAKAAREGTAKKEEMAGSTITLTSLGPLGGVAHTPVVNHPETAIVGPNRIIERPVVRDGVVVVRRMMNLSSSFDHRVVDGYDAAEFIQAVKALLEHPATLFMD